MHTNYHTVGFFLETEMIHFFKKMFSFLNSFLHFQVMRKCPILNTLSMTMEGLFWSILVKFILKKKKSRPYVLISPQSAKGNSGERWVLLLIMTLLKKMLTAFFA